LKTYNTDTTNIQAAICDWPTAKAVAATAIAPPTAYAVGAPNLL